MSRQERRLGIRLTEEEENLIRERMKDSGIDNLSAYIREMALNGYMINVDVTDVKEMCRLLSRYGNNINQIAKRANESGVVNPSDIHSIQSQMDEMFQLMRRILKKLIDFF